MSRVVNLAEVVFFGELRPPDLHEKRFAEIEELVAVVIGQSIRLVWVEILSWDPVYLISTEITVVKN
jgi:hypothetical protein